MAISRSQRRLAPAASPVSAAAAPASNSASGRSGARRRAASASAAAAPVSPSRRSAAASSACASGSCGIGGDGAVERGLRRRPVGLGGGGPGAQQQAARVRLGDAVGAIEGLGGEVGPAGGEPLAGGVLEDDGPERRGHGAVRAFGDAGQQQRGGAVGAERGEGVGLAQAGRNAAAGAGPEGRLLAGHGGIRGHGGGALLGRPDFRGGRQRGEGGEEEQAAHGRGLARGAMRTLVTLGHGYSAAALAASLAGWRVVGTTRSPEKAAAMRAAGVEPVDWADRAAVDRAIAAADALLASLPPAADGDPVIARHADALAGTRAEWAGYLSTTGVYGDRRGGWADEEDALEPSGERGRRRVAAEAAWTATGLPVHHFRLAGIYGPGRSVLDRLRAGRAQRVVKPGPGVQPHPRRRHRRRPRRLARPPGPRPRLQRRRRPAGAARGS